VPHHDDVVEQVERLRRAPLLLALAAPVGLTLAAPVGLTLAASRPSRDGSLGSASPVLSRLATAPQRRRLVQPWCDERLGPGLETARGGQRPARIGPRRTATATAAAAKTSLAPRSRRKKRAAFAESRPPAVADREQARRRRLRRQQRRSSRTVHPHLVSRVARVHLVRELATLVGDAAWRR